MGSHPSSPQIMGHSKKEVIPLTSTFYEFLHRMPSQRSNQAKYPKILGNPLKYSKILGNWQSRNLDKREGPPLVPPNTEIL